MFDIDASLPAEVIPLSWLLGVWEGTGVIAYRVDDDLREHEFGQRIAFTQDGGRHVQYACSTWLLGGDADGRGLLFSEIGYWRVSRPLGAADPGPGMLPGVGDRVFTTAESVETLRNASGSFDIEVSILQPGGVSELYLGTVEGPRIDLGTDAVVRSSTAKEYAAATRLYGLVDDHLLWAWDIAALGQDLRTHASGRLARVE
ncbi:MAG TPA: FABP family protein [Pseudolysinimonas sp.]|nr:FABP family protein [Pseudolysinimonas sp.]